MYRNYQVVGNLAAAAINMVDFYSDRIHSAKARPELCEFLASLAFRGGLARDASTVMMILQHYDDKIKKKYSASAKRV